MRRPLVLDLDLSQLQSGPRGPAGNLPPGPLPWRSPDLGLEQVGAWSGSALALAVLLRDARAGRELPFVVAVGDAVRRGLPSAARATVAARAPLSGLYADGQVGGELGRRLASTVDALVLRGRTELPGAVLHLGERGRVELLAFPELAGQDTLQTGRRLAERFGSAGVLCVGPAGERQVALASLANGEDPPSLVGRGGLGATFGALGLKALVVTAPPVRESRDETELTAALLSSPRLLGRGEGGTLELMHAFAARRDLRSRNYEQAVDRRTAGRLVQALREAPREQRGCRGCPTPCGWVLESPGGYRGARFSAVYALGLNLGIEELGATLWLLEACDLAGVDAKEAGAALALLAAARERGLAPGPKLFGKPELLVELVEQLARGEGEGARLARGSAALAAELGLGRLAHAARSQAVRPESNLAVVLGQCVSARGSDPMRTFPFLTGDAGDRERMEELLEPLTLAMGAEDPRRPEGKGRMVWWHENFALAVDMTGFCAFSAAGLLADRAAELDQIAAAILPAAAWPEGTDPGRALLAAGASLAVLQRELCELLGAPPGLDSPDWAAELLELPGMWDEYRALRGLDDFGRALPAARERVGREELLDVGLDDVDEPFVLWPRRRTFGAPVQAPGYCTLRSFGPLADSIGDEIRVLLQLPARMEDVLDQVVRRSPRAGDFLLQGGRPLAAVYRGGRRLAPADLVEAEDELDLVVAISGG